MNILILNWKDIKNPDAGGSEVVVFEFAKRLIKKKHKVILFCRKFKGCREEEEIEGVKVIRRGNKLSVYFEAFLYYKNLKIKPDKVIEIVNTICWQTPLYVSFKKRIVLVNQLAKEVLFFEFPVPLSIISYFLEKLEYIFYRRTKCLCYSESTKKDLIEFGIKEKNIKIFPIGLNHKRYKKGNKKSGNPLFVFVGRLVKMKRADLCIKGIKKILDKYPNSKLVIIGNGPEKENLKLMVKKDDLENSVVFTNKDGKGFAKTEKLKIKLMQEAWSLILPSVKEGWGMVVTEAGACGTPSIVSNVTGLRDAVLQNTTGLVLSKYPNENEISDAMAKIINDRVLRKKMSTEVIKFSKKFSWERSFNKFYDFLQN